MRAINFLKILKEPGKNKKNFLKKSRNCGRLNAEKIILNIFFLDFSCYSLDLVLL